MPKAYNADSIVTLTDLEKVRKTKSIYAGDDDKTALWLCVREPIDNTIDECIAAKSDTVIVIRHESGFYIYDNGRGIPVENHPTQKISALQVVFTQLAAGAKGEANSYSDSKNVYGVHGMGAAVSNALSKSFSAYTYRGGWFRYQSVNGKTLGRVAKANPADTIDSAVIKAMFPDGKIPRKGTIVHVLPDYTLFDNEKLDSEIIISYLEFKSLFLLKINFTFVDLTVTDKTPYHFGNKTQKDANKSIETILTDGLDRADIKSQIFTYSGNDCDVAFCISSKIERRINTFVCASPTPERGTHWTGFCNAVETAIQPFVKKKQIFDTEVFLDGFSGFLNFNISPPSFSGQAKQKLKSKAATKIVQDALTAPLTDFFKKNSQHVRSQIEHAVNIKSQSNKLANERGLDKAVSSGKSLPFNLTSCPYAKPKDRELYILEGLSAAGPAKKARDPKVQEVLPINGKIVNVYRSAAKALVGKSATPIQELMRSIGYSKDDLNLNKARIQNKIIILSDADEDGKHIRILLIAFLWKFFPQAFHRKMVYYADTPIYSYDTGDTEKIFGDTIAELRQGVEKKKIKFDTKLISRAKGWAKVSPADMRKIAFNPATRKLVNIPPLTKDDEKDFYGIIQDPDAGYRAKILGLPLDVLDASAIDDEDLAEAV